MTTDNINTEDTVPPEPTVPCHLCGDQVPESEVHDSMEIRFHRTYTHVYLCEACSYSVSRCEIVMRNCLGWSDDLTYTEDGYACQRCVGYYEYCDYCDEYRRDGCDSCREDECGLIKPYGYKPDAVFFLGGFRSTTRVPNGVTVGVELEIGTVEADRYEVAQVVQDSFGDFVYLKDDCSVSQYDGFEIVSHPFTLEYLRELPLEDIMSNIVNAGGRAGRFSDCGLHAHIGRRLFVQNPTALYRMFALLYDNQSKWQAIGGRGDVHWAEWDRRNHGNVMDYVRHAHAVKTGKRNRRGDSRQAQWKRHVAINLMNDETIELRYAKGTLNANTLRARFEGYFGLAMYSLSTKYTNIRELGRWEPFIDFAQSQKLDTFVVYAEARCADLS